MDFPTSKHPSSASVISKSINGRALGSNRPKTTSYASRLLLTSCPHVSAQFSAESHFVSGQSLDPSKIGSFSKNDSTEKRPKTGFLHMNHSGNFRRTIKKPGFFSELIGRVQAGSQFATRKNNTTTSVLHNRECGKSAIPIMVGAGWRGIDL